MRVHYRVTPSIKFSGAPKLAFIHLSGERHCDNKVSAEEHNSMSPSQESGSGSNPGQRHRVVFSGKTGVINTYLMLPGVTPSDGLAFHARGLDIILIIACYKI